MLATVRPTSSLTRTPQWANVSMTATSRAGQADRTFDGGGAAAAASSRSTSSGRNASTSPDDVRLTVSSGASHGLVGRWSRRTSQPQNPRIVDSARCRLDGARSAPSRSSARSSTSTSPSSVMTYCQPSSECGGNAGTCLPWTSLMAAAHRRRSARRARSELPGSSLDRPTRLAASQSSAISCHDGSPAGRTRRCVRLGHRCVIIPIITRRSDNSRPADGRITGTRKGETDRQRRNDLADSRRGSDEYHRPSIGKEDPCSSASR